MFAILLKKFVFEHSKENWTDETTHMGGNHNISKHFLISLKQFRSSFKKSNNLFTTKLLNKRKKRTPKFEISDCLSTFHKRVVFLESDCSNWCLSYIKWQKIDDTIPIYHLENISEIQRSEALVEKTDFKLKKLRLLSTNYISLDKIVLIYFHVYIECFVCR